MRRFFISMGRMFRVLTCCAIGCAAVASGEEPFQKPATEELHAAEAINDAMVRGHIRFLADDLLEGRGPGTRGDQLAQRYIATQFQSLGLQPAAPGGGYYQQVPLVGVTTKAPATLTFTHTKGTVDLKYFDEFIANAGRPEGRIAVTDADLVFVGYGIVAPEYDWNDYKDVDVKGKVLLMMNNDPAGDPKLFEGNRRLYYGRWSYKYEIAAAKGAIGAIIIHTVPSAGYPFKVVQTSWTGEEFELQSQTGPRVDLKGWVTEDAARKVVALGGRDLDELRAAAERRDFRPVTLDTRLSIDLTCEVRKNETANVLALLPGSDPELRKEYVVYMAHHDHLGLAAERNAQGDQIYNGAIDNATGSAALLAIAQAYTRLPKRPARSILFAAVGAEEQGLLGSAHMAVFPPTAAGNLAAVINIDGLNSIGKSRDVNVVGYGKSSLDQIVESVAKWQERYVTPDMFPDRGFYYRSDQFSLAKIGVPGVYLHSGTDIIGKPSGWGRQQIEDWEAKHYHQPSDEYNDDWDLSGGIVDARLLFHVGVHVANQKAMPAWNPGDEFEAARKAAIKAR